MTLDQLTDTIKDDLSNHAGVAVFVEPEADYGGAGLIVLDEENKRLFLVSVQPVKLVVSDD